MRAGHLRVGITITKLEALKIHDDRHDGTAEPKERKRLSDNVICVFMNNDSGQ